MNINEAYCKGLDDAENAVIVRIKQLMNGEAPSIMSNPKLEDAFRDLHDHYISGLDNIVDGIQIEQMDVDIIAEQLGRVLTKSGPTFHLEIDNEKLQKFNTALTGFMEYIHEISTNAKSPIGRKIEKNLKTALDIINS